MHEGHQLPRSPMPKLPGARAAAAPGRASAGLRDAEVALAGVRLASERTGDARPSLSPPRGRALFIDGGPADTADADNPDEMRGPARAEIPEAGSEDAPGGPGGHPDEDRWVTEFDGFRELGRGDFGHVSAAQHAGDGRRYAVKIMREARGRREAQSRLQEAFALASVPASPHLLRYYDAWFDGEGRLHLQTELLGGGSVRSLHPPGAWPEAALWGVLRQAALGVHAMHAAEVAHFDIKPDNLLFDPAPRLGATHPEESGLDGGPLIKVGDWGLARPIRHWAADSAAAPTPDAGSSAASAVSGGACTPGCEASPPLAAIAAAAQAGNAGQEPLGINDDEGDFRYLCPELLGRGGPVDPRAVDVYALGATLVDLAGGDPNRARVGDIGPLAQAGPGAPCPPRYGAELAAIVQRMIAADPAQRPSAFEIVRACVERPRGGDATPRTQLAVGGLQRPAVPPPVAAAAAAIDGLRAELAELEAATACLGGQPPATP